MGITISVRNPNPPPLGQFVNQTEVFAGDLIESNVITANKNYTVSVNSTESSQVEWRINSGAWSTGTANLLKNDTFQIRVEAAEASLTEVDTVMGFDDGATEITRSFSVTTDNMDVEISPGVLLHWDTAETDPVQWV